MGADSVTGDLLGLCGCVHYVVESSSVFIGEPALLCFGGLVDRI